MADCDHDIAVWHCSCAERPLCAMCLLKHLQNPGTHTTSYRGLQSQFLCGKCGSVADCAISCVYPIYLCFNCMRSLSGGAEMHAKVMEARPPAVGAEAAAKQRGAQPLRAQLSQKRNDFRQRFFDNMNNIEEIISQAILLDQELAQCKERLGVAEAALAERGLRVQGGRDAADLGQIAGIMERVEAVNQENGRVKAENQALVARVQALESQVVHQSGLHRQIEALTAEIASLKAELRETLQTQAEESAKMTADQVQETLKDRLKDTARIAAEKVTDMIPLVAHLKLDSAWLNSEIAENLFQVASLGIADKLDSAEMRVVARVSLLLAKLLGPCEHMAAFSKGIPTLFAQNPDRALTQLKNLETLYLAAKGEADFKEVAKDMMKRLKDRECEEALKVIAKFCQVLSPKGTCEFAKSVSSYYKKKDQAYQEWKEALLELPLNWSDAPHAAKCLESLVMGVAYSNFSAGHLALVRLLEAYSPADEATLLAFGGRAATLLNRDSVRRPLHDYVLEASRHVENSMRVPGAKGQQLCELVYSSMNLVGERATAEDIGKALQLLRELFQELTAIRDFNGTPATIAPLLSALEIQQSQKTQEVADSAVALVQAGLLESVFNSLVIFSKLVKSEEPSALALTKEVLSVLLNFANERNPLSRVLRTAARVLCSASPATPLVHKCFTAWKDGRARGVQVSTYCDRVLNSLRAPDTEQMLDSVIAAFAQGNTAHAVVSTLLEIHMEGGLIPSTLNSHLKTLKGIQGAQVLSPLLAKVRDQLVQPRHQVLFLGAVLDLCTTENVQILNAQMDSLLDNPVLETLLKVLSQLQPAPPGLVKDFLDVARQNPNVLPVVMQLASVYVELQAQGTLEVNIPEKVKSALLQRSVDMSELIPSVMALLQNREHQMGELCLKVLGEFGVRATEPIEIFVLLCDVVKDLVEFVEPKAVVAFGNVVLEAKEEVQQSDLKTNLAHIKERLIELLNKAQERVTLQDVLRLMHKRTQSQSTELVNVQSTLMRFFDFKNSQWKQPIQLKKQIQCSSNSEFSYTILDDESVFCCGGTSHAGYNSGSTVHTASQVINVAYILGRDGAVTDLPPMKGARYIHGIIFIHSNRTTYVFGGGK